MIGCGVHENMAPKSGKVELINLTTDIDGPKLQRRL